MFDVSKFEEVLKQKKLKRKDLAKLLGINRTTLFRRTADSSGDFKYYEIQKMIEIFGYRETMSFLFPEQVALCNKNGQENE